MFIEEEKDEEEEEEEEEEKNLIFLTSPTIIIRSKHIDKICSSTIFHYKFTLIS